MERNRSQKSIISTGTTSIVLIFVMLCLLTFSVLSLTSAEANLRLIQLSADRTTDYYDAENAANDILIRIDEILNAAYQSSITADDFYVQAREALKDEPDVFLNEGGVLSYQVPLGENQMLAVELSVSYDTLSNGHHYAIESWQAVSGYDWNPDDTLNLMTLPLS